jgi:hypothetical protein
MKRRAFLKSALTATALISRHSPAAEIANGADEALHFVSGSMELQLSAVGPRFLSFNIDGLGKGRRGANIIGGNNRDGGYTASSSSSGGVRRVEYRSTFAGNNSPPAWVFEFSGSRIVLTSEWSANFEPPGMDFHFDLNQVHSTVLGVFGRSNLLALPAFMHFPGQGSVRITANLSDLGLSYQSDRPKQVAALSLPGASFEKKRVVYTLDVTATIPTCRESRMIRASTRSAATGSMPCS